MARSRAADGNSYAYAIATASGPSGITGFNPNKFAFDTSGFANPIADLAIVRIGDDIVLSFTGVPEPSTWALIVLAAFFAVGLLRRRAKSRAASTVLH